MGICITAGSVLGMMIAWDFLTQRIEAPSREKCWPVALDLKKPKPTCDPMFDRESDQRFVID
jgi:hypothetical protein